MKRYNDFIELMNNKNKCENGADKIEKSKKKILETMVSILHYKKTIGKVSKQLICHPRPWRTILGGALQMI